MALRPAYLEYIESGLLARFGKLGGLRMLELGDQRMRGPGKKWKTGKAYFSAKGIAHTSVDMNGFNGSEVFDLGGARERADWQSAFDVITNCGTTEHIEPLEAQYVCFKHLHSWLKPGGVAFHLVPDAGERARGRWAFHCNHYYSLEFFGLLAEANGYTVQRAQIIDGLICVTLLKSAERPFMTDRRLLLDGIERREDGILYPAVRNPIAARISWLAYGLHYRSRVLVDGMARRLKAGREASNVKPKQ